MKKAERSEKNYNTNRDSEEKETLSIRSLKFNVSHYVVWHVVWIWFYVSRQMKGLVNRSMKICSDENESYCTHALCHAKSRSTAKLAQLRVSSLCLYTQNTLRLRRFWQIFSSRFYEFSCWGFYNVVNIESDVWYESNKCRRMREFYSMTVSAEMTKCLAKMKRSS